MTFRHIRRASFALRTIAASTLAVVLAASWSADARARTASGALSIRLGSTVGRVDAGATGADMPFWNRQLLDRHTVERIRQVGIGTLGFDAGAPLDLYDFRTNTLRPDPNAARDEAAGLNWSALTPQWTFDDFEQTARAAGVQTVVHVDYGTAGPSLAADWVRYANLRRHDHVRDWVIGEEVYLDQFIEPNRRVPATMRSAAADAQDYGRGVIRFARAMKSVDPTIRVGVEAFAIDPAQAVDGEAAYLAAWTHALIATPGLARAADFADVHWLGSFEGTTMADQLATTRQIAPAMADLRQAFDAQPDGRHVQTVAGEVNSAAHGAPYLETPGNGAYLADTEFTLLEHGVRQTDWFALYNGPDGPSAAYDFGLLSSGSCPAGPGSCEPPAATRFPPFWAQDLVSSVLTPGTRLVAATTDSADVSAHAVRGRDGLAIVLVNRSGTVSSRVRVPAALGAGAGVRQTTGRGIVRHPAGTSVDLPPYSVTVLSA